MLHQCAVDRILNDDQLCLLCDSGNHYPRFQRHDMCCWIVIIRYDINTLYIFILYRIPKAFFGHLTIPSLNWYQLDAQQLCRCFCSGKRQRIGANPIATFKKRAQSRHQRVLSPCCQCDMSAVRLKAGLLKPDRASLPMPSRPFRYTIRKQSQSIRPLQQSL